MKTLSQTRIDNRPAVVRSRRTRAIRSARAGGLALKVCRILVPIDFSLCSVRAFEYAKALAARFKASVTLLHVAEIGSPGYEFGSADFAKMEMSIRQQALTKLTHLGGKHGAYRVPIDVSVRSGWPFGGGRRPYWEIVQAAKQQPTDLIVIGTRGSTGLDHLLLGSTAERVVRHAPCPVLVVRERETKTSPRANKSDQP